MRSPTLLEGVIGIPEQVRRPESFAEAASRSPDTSVAGVTASQDTTSSLRENLISGTVNEHTNNAWLLADLEGKTVARFAARQWRVAMSQTNRPTSRVPIYWGVAAIASLLVAGLLWTSTRNSGQPEQGPEAVAFQSDPSSSIAGASTTSSPATSASSPGTSSPSTPATSAPATSLAGPTPLLLGISIHVEGWEDEAENKEKFLVHRRAVEQMAIEASEAGMILTFELSRSFMTATRIWEDDIIDVLVGHGQGIAVHADIGGRGNPTLNELVRPLREMRITLENLGAKTTHVSGICSRGPWIEAALEAGYTSTSGAVEYCLTSLDEENLPEGHQDIASCSSPSLCHGEPPMSVDQKLHPFLVDDSSDFLAELPTAREADALLLIIGEAGHSVSCLAEHDGGGAGCSAASDDLPFVAQSVEEYLLAMSTPIHSASQTAILSWSWSVGESPSEGFTTELAELIAPYVDSGQIQWVSMDDMAAMARP